jgi:hypothetical protein
MEGGKLIFRRSFTSGENNSILFPVDQYGRLKLYFDRVDRQDNRAVTIESATNQLAAARRWKPLPKTCPGLNILFRSSNRARAFEPTII